MDDEFLVRELLNEILRNEGFAVLTAANGVQAVEFARTESPDLILLDLMIPTLDGVEVLRILKSDPSTRGIAIIAMSAGRIFYHPDSLLVDGFLGKPFDIHALHIKVALRWHDDVDLKRFRVAWD